MSNNITVKHLNGKLHDHFIFKMSAGGKLDNGDKVYCIHCNKKFAYRGSNTLLIYYLQHKHILKYQHVIKNNRESTSEVPEISNYFLSQSNRPLNDKVSADLIVSIAHWIASSGCLTAIVKDAGLQTVMRTAIQNQTYNLPSRRTIDNMFDKTYEEKLVDHKKAIESVHSIALSTDF